MRFVSVRDLRGRTAELWRDLATAREMVVTNNGKPIAILSATDEDSFEDSLRALRRCRAGDALGKLQRDAELRGLGELSATETQAEIRASRKRRSVS
jgi:antitoxin (DNA-binding transcriptional repressor) of toxin-antitoxin stability system